VVSFGAGTKFMPQRAIVMDTDGVCVRDCHAEVLARRAFIRFMYLQVQNAKARHDACWLEGSVVAGAGSAGQEIDVQEASCGRNHAAAAPLRVLPKTLHHADILECFMSCPLHSL
jgi:Adenosine-deaminase (editase) domain